MRGILFALSTALLLSCGSGSKATVRSESPKKPEAFDPAKVSRQVKDLTMGEVQRFIEELNTVIRNKDYKAWKQHLSNERYNEISSKEFLQRQNSSNAMKTRRITLKNAEDYFNNVVVPARNSARVDDTVDDIDFVTRSRVKAYTIQTMRDGSERRLILYELEQSGTTWKIIK